METFIILFIIIYNILGPSKICQISQIFLNNYLWYNYSNTTNIEKIVYVSF